MDSYRYLDPLKNISNLFRSDIYSQSKIFPMRKPMLHVTTPFLNLDTRLLFTPLLLSLYSHLVGRKVRNAVFQDSEFVRTQLIACIGGRPIIYIRLSYPDCKAEPDQKFAVVHSLRARVHNIIKMYIHRLSHYSKKTYQLVIMLLRTISCNANQLCV